MGAWRRTPALERPSVWIIQETHVSTQEEADQLEEDWKRVWGKHKKKGGPRLSYWSVHNQKSGGVAILLDPAVADTVVTWEQERWSNRCIAVKMSNTILMNIYAPNQPADREDFFAGSAEWKWSETEVVIAGDFNSVQSPLLDRMGGTRSARPESSALQQLLETLGMEDARTLAESGDEDPAVPEAIDYYTYWGPDAASRIDRFYVPTGWTAQVQVVEVREPLVASDHQSVRMHLQRGSHSKSNRRRRRDAVYPIRSANPDRVQMQIMKELMEAGVGKDISGSTWDSTVHTCGECIQRVAGEEVQHRKAVRHRLNAQDRAHLVTRRDLLQVNADDLQKEMLVRMGQKLERTMEQLRWSYKRVSNWESDQSVTEIERINGKPFVRGMNIADKFKSEWHPVLGVVHSDVEPEDLEKQFDKFVQIPQSRRISAAQNMELMREISEDEVIAAIVALNRHKAAGPDGINNDFFKDFQPLLIPAMVAIGNELLKGAQPPASFLEGLIIPLRKKGDSTDAMNFRPISLLQTGYKVYTKVIAIRMQTLLGTPIGDSQQGFVHGRQMMKTVMMMLAMLATANNEPELAAGHSRLILLLDFRKAYDTVSREFLFLALIKFGFSPEFVEMIRKLHEGTTAIFLVNGELSEKLEVVTGIRQGCPLAPLLFILAAEVLALAIRQDQQTQGVQVPGGEGARHKFSAFVDDSTVFMQQANQLPRIMELVERFGKISGLQVQPAKSHIIFLNTAVNRCTYEGIPVLKHGDTVRYLGYAVGTGELTDINWANRIRAVQRRLATATQLATSVDNRATLFNVIMLPSLLFTAAAFNMPTWAAKQLCNMQKQFLWRHSTSTEATKHKMNPGLVYAPKQAGGVGLASIPLACKTQRMKHTIQWLIQRKDIYYAAWKAWMFRGERLAWTLAVSPKPERRRGQPQKWQTPGDELQQLVGEWQQPPQGLDAEELQQHSQELERAADEAMSWTVGDLWLLELQQELSEPRQKMMEEDQRFWPTFTWVENPWIRDKEGCMLTARKFHRIKPCAIEDLRIARTGRTKYSFRIPKSGKASHGQAKLQRWAIAILMNSPALEEGETLRVGDAIRMRHPPALQGSYTWKVDPSGNVLGIARQSGTGEKQTIELEQQTDGVHWNIKDAASETEETCQDKKKLRQHQHEGGLVFYAHPRCHRFAWTVTENVANKHVLKAIKQQPFNKYKWLTRQLAKQIEGLSKVAITSTWQTAVMTQTPTTTLGA